MAEQQQDLRVKKTQRALATAMLALLETQAFTKITVRDLCAEAMISRSTFYVHFEDKYALLHFCLEALRERLFPECDDRPYKVRLKGFLEILLENKKLLKNLLGSELDIELSEMMRKGFQKDIEDQMERDGKTEDDLPGPPDILTAYYAAGVTSLILYWISKSKPDPVDDIVACLSALLAPI